MDKYDIKGNQTKRPLNLSFESALTYGDWDINRNPWGQIFHPWGQIFHLDKENGV